MAPPPRILFESDTLVVRAYLGRAPNLCFVVFDPMVDDGALDRPAFAESFLAAYGHDAIHVLSAQNRWYQVEGLPAALASVRSVTRGYERVVAYGSSMGGYAALRFSDRVGADAVVAVSPQYSVLPSVSPFETRWMTQKRDLIWLFEHPGDRLPRVDEAVVIFDDRGLDKNHVNAILRDLPHCLAVPVPHAGHPATGMLADISRLSSVVMDAALGRLDLPKLAVDVRRERHMSGQYLYSLARRQPVWRLRLKARLAERAALTAPQEAHYWSYAGLVYDCLGRAVEALQFHERATERPGLGLPELRRARSLWRAGSVREAREAAVRARLRLQQNSAPVEIIALGYALEGDAGAALATLASDPRLAGYHRLRNAILTFGSRPAVRTRIAGHLACRIGRRLVGRTVLVKANTLKELAEADRD